jgi:RimJ/RimL family protein N-acetyltransferase
MKKQINGEKVILREQRAEDAEFFAHWFSQPDIMFKCGFTEPVTVENELNAIRQKKPHSDWYTITDKSGRIIGETGLLRMWPEWHCTDLTIIIPDPKDQGNGYGSEAINLMFDLAFRHYDMNRISIGVVGLNKYALDFYKGVGFKQEGIQEQGYFYNEEYSDFIMMRILRDEYLERTGK